jgi:hypothetical protein
VNIIAPLVQGQKCAKKFTVIGKSALLKRNKNTQIHQEAVLGVMNIIISKSGNKIPKVISQTSSLLFKLELF